ncbi:MAG: NADH-quinone oxidoreductase subunit NuoG [Zoogloeaceae bacterium]|jgi:NADH-quinone oxidoreductase subunit G|nr:NADH-quinone oxidoreductase subunit NuoG [Zoogloeaceae bacterium]
MLEIEIDGKKAQAPDGSTVMEAAREAGVYIPHFCYHKKLSIAANCRMCLVEVEKAAKPLPACATPVTHGMKVFTHSHLAVKAQKAVMEFLLINHPLDCPVCDQGGECQLQDIAVGYGGVKSRFAEAKHVTVEKNAGPLISMREMSRCIHCTRCVRFGQEVAGVMELGMAGRNVHSEIMTFMGRAIDSELSGNMIDLCPVGALTSKPFRYTARAWEMERQHSISPHDSVGANLVVEVKRGKVMRVLPRENEAVNECWISDKERFSYSALNSEERLVRPMLKQGGAWREVAWRDALDYVAHGLKDIAARSGGDALAALAAPWSTVEELYLLKKLLRGLGSSRLDFRPRQQDLSTDNKRQGAPWLGMRLADLRHLESALIVGSFLRKDHPLMTQRLRHAAQKHRAEISVVSVCGDDPFLPLFARETVAPSQLAHALAAVLKAAAIKKGVRVEGVAGLENVPVSEKAAAIAQSLLKHERKAIFLGQAAEQSADAGKLHALALKLAEITGAVFGFLGSAANSVGGYLVTAPQGVGDADTADTADTHARQIFASPRQAYLLFGVEPELDCAHPREALAALKSAGLVAQFSAFKHSPALEYADALLPLAPFTETSGTFVNAEGRIQSFTGVVSPLGEARPGWKILRVLGNVLDLPGFDYETSEAVRDAALPQQETGDRGQETEAFAAGLDNGLTDASVVLTPPEARGLERVADVPIHFADPIARRSSPLQATADAAPPTARMAAGTLARLGIQAGETVIVRQGAGSARLVAAQDDGVPEGCAHVAAGHAVTASLGGMFDAIAVETAKPDAEGTGAGDGHA